MIRHESFPSLRHPYLWSMQLSLSLFVFFVRHLNSDIITLHDLIYWVSRFCAKVPPAASMVLERPVSLESLADEANSWDALLKQKEEAQSKTTYRRRRRSYSGGSSSSKFAPRSNSNDCFDETFRTVSVSKGPVAIGALTQRRRPKKDRRRNPYLIPSDHPGKIAWDVCTILLSLLSAYHTHLNIKDRKFSLHGLTEIWFFVDILLNFVTEHKSTLGRTYKAVWARYLTTWFVVDALSLLPWETLYVQPLFDAQKRRGFFAKSFFRTRAVVRVTRVLRGRHFRLFGQVAKHTKHAGVGANRLLRLIIRYVPKYLLFYRNMKGVLAVRVLRQVHWIRKLIKNIMARKTKRDDDTSSLTEQDDLQYQMDYDDDGEDDDLVEVYFDEDVYETDL